MTGLVAVFAVQAYAQDAQENLMTPEMINVPGGTFEMGNNFTQNTAVSDEAPGHKVTVSSFKMSKHEVPFELFDLFCDATGWDKPKEIKGRGKNPAVNVSWEAAIQFCNWLSSCNRIEPYYEVQSDSSSFRVTCKENSKGYRLPTEAEWEYAARGGKDGKPTSFSGSHDPNLVAWYKANSGTAPHEIGKKQPNELGIYDMTGNVWEWCWDVYDKGEQSQGRREGH